MNQFSFYQVLFVFIHNKQQKKKSLTQKRCLTPLTLHFKQQKINNIIITSLKPNTEKKTKNMVAITTTKIMTLSARPTEVVLTLATTNTAPA